MKMKYSKPILIIEGIFDNIGMRCYGSTNWGWQSGGCT